MDSHSYTAALIFAEELMMYVMNKNGIHYQPCTSGRMYRLETSSEFTRNIGDSVGNLVTHLSHKMRNTTTNVIHVHWNLPNTTSSDFPNGYNPFSFLEFCGKIALHAKHFYPFHGEGSLVDKAVILIAATLAMFMRSGQFERSSGWPGLWIAAVGLADPRGFEHNMATRE